MMSAIFYFQHILNRLFKQLYKVILILDKFFLKYEAGVKLPSPAIEKTTLKKSSLIRVKLQDLFDNHKELK